MCHFLITIYSQLKTSIKENCYLGFSTGVILSKYWELELVKYKIFRDKFSSLRFFTCLFIFLTFPSSSKILELGDSRHPFSRVLFPSFHPDFESGFEINFSNLEFDSKFPPFKGLSPELEFWTGFKPELISSVLGFWPKLDFQTQILSLCFL